MIVQSFVQFSPHCSCLVAKCIFLRRVSLLGSFILSYPSSSRQCVRLQGHEECVSVLLKDARVNPSHPLGGTVGGGARPLTIAADRNRLEVCLGFWGYFFRYYMVNSQDSRVVDLSLVRQLIHRHIWALNPLLLLCVRCQVVDLLLADSRVDPNAQTNDGATALYAACQVGAYLCSWFGGGAFLVVNVCALGLGKAEWHDSVAVLTAG